MFELILNVALLLFFVYTLAFHVLEAPVPAKVQRNPYALQPGVWPTVLLVILIVLMTLNIIKLIRQNKGKEGFTLPFFLSSIPVFLKSKIFFGILIVVAASFLLEPLGFMVTSFLLLFSYGLLLGDKKYLRLAIVCLLVTILLYVCFGVLLQVNLPRGTVSFLRNFALFLEQLVS